MAILDYIEGWYNLYRRHSAFEYNSPLEYEKKISHDCGLKQKPLTVHQTGSTPGDGGGDEGCGRTLMG
jgi:hypothetical protein